MNFAPMKPLLELAEEKGIAYGAFVTVSYSSSRIHKPCIYYTAYGSKKESK